MAKEIRLFEAALADSPKICVEGKEERALIVLNCDIPPQLHTLWESCECHVFADGGANQIYAIDQTLIPDALVGDLDSVEPKVKEYYVNKGAELVVRPDQNSDDVTKCIMHIKERFPQIKELILIGVFGKNITQELANFNIFFFFPDIPIYFVGEHNIMTMLRPGEYIISSPRRFTCGFVPFGYPVERVTTTGLRWNVDGPVQYGGIVSSSNEMEQRTVTLKTSHSLLWSFDIKKPLE